MATDRVPLKLCFHCLGDLSTVYYRLGFEGCVYQHGFCTECFLELCADEEQRCPVDGRSGAVAVDSYNSKKLFDRRDYQTLRYLYQKYAAGGVLNLFSFFEPYIKQCFNCLGELYEENSRVFIGFEGCYDKHRFCGRCIIELCTGEDRRCPVDGISINSTVVLYGDMVLIYGFGTNIQISDALIDIFEYLRGRMRGGFGDRDSFQQIVLSLLRGRGFPLTVCAQCLQANSNLSSLRFGFEACIYEHRFCSKCIKELRCGKSICPVDGISSRVVGIGEVKCLTDAHVATVRYLKTAMRGGKNTKIENILRTIRTTGRNPGNACLKCLGDLSGNGNTRYGYSGCYEEHSFCMRCIIGLTEGGDMRCPIDGLWNSNIVVVKGTTVYNLKKRQRETLRQLMQNVGDNSKIKLEKMNSEIYLSQNCTHRTIE